MKQNQLVDGYVTLQDDKDTASDVTILKKFPF